jgi:response regulator RpfG family c-di-GMP phosphodiesterase
MTESHGGDDDWLLEEDEEQPADVTPPIEQRLWRVLIVDDDQDVHAVTRLACAMCPSRAASWNCFRLQREAEGFKILRDTPDIALVLLDVVMETDDAGLMLARRIREELHNAIVRVVLRTGQPGQAPEQRVIIEYDINDYKAKTELTTQKLFTTVISALRAYESLNMLERSRVGLGKILAGATNLYQIHSLREFASGVLNQVSAILDVGADGVLCLMRPTPATPTVVAATGNYAPLADNEHAGRPRAAADHRQGLRRKEQPVRASGQRAVHPYHGKARAGISASRRPGRWPRSSATCWKCSASASPPPSTTCTCSASCARRRKRPWWRWPTWPSSATAAWAAMCAGCRTPVRAIAERLKERGVYQDELSPQLLDMIGLASILHDVGKVATPDAILLKPGRAHAGRKNRHAAPCQRGAHHARTRRQHGRRRQLPHLRRRNRRRAPRALRRARLSERPARQADSAVGAHRVGGRRVRLAAARTHLQGPVAASGSDDLHPRPARRPVRSGSGARLLESNASWRAIRATAQAEETACRRMP